MRDKSVVLVTHQMQFIKETSKILYLSDGECHAIGNFEQLQKSGIDFVSIMKEQNKTVQTENDIKKCDEKYKSFEENFSNINYKQNQELKIEDELKENESEQMDLKLYYDYFKAGSSLTLIIVALLSTILTQFLFHFTDYWLTLW